MMELAQIYQPINEELREVEKVLEDSLMKARNKSILDLNRFLLKWRGKRLRPALVILCAKVSLSPKQCTDYQDLIKIASAIELIHIASLIHDDVIDHALLRHHQPTINSKFGQDVSIALGDYLYSLAFKLISRCGNADILDCISSATKAMCEGELIQVSERDNFSLLKQRYILIIKKKTAELFAASCRVGALFSKAPKSYEEALRDYGLNFGIAFQIIDDCLDLVGQNHNLGKPLGQDFKMGELTLPVLNLLTQAKDRNRIFSLISQQSSLDAFRELRQRFINSLAYVKTRNDAFIYIQKAKRSLNKLDNSCVRQSLFYLADFIIERF